MKKFLLLSLIITAFQSNAQKSQYTFFSKVNAGFLEGEKGPAFQIHSVNGFSKKTWSVGLGAGLDYYVSRSIPLFIDVQKTLRTKAKSPLLYISSGYNIPWLSRTDSRFIKVKAIGGLYLDAGIGYQFPVGKQQNAFQLLAGYSVKKTTINESYTIGFPTPIETLNSFDYTFRRLSIKAAFRF